LHYVSLVQRLRRVRDARSPLGDWPLAPGQPGVSSWGGWSLLECGGKGAPGAGRDAQRHAVAVAGVAYRHAFGRGDFDALPAVAAAVAALTPVVHIPVTLSIRARDSLAL